MSLFLTLRRPPTSTLFPYTTLFRSCLKPAYSNQTPQREACCRGAFFRCCRGAGQTIVPRSGSYVYGGSLADECGLRIAEDRKSTRLNSSHANISYAVFCLKKKNKDK